MKEFQLTEFATEGEKLLTEVQGTFQHFGFDTSGLPTSLSDDDEPLKLVFVGQYSAGKSSVIKMLTGEDVAIGAKITTQTAQAYPWHGIEIVDTPGIHTELRADHDELTYEEINHAALLVFVITNEGFSQRIGDHFRKLAIEQKRGGNMVLVVNKMDRTALGNVQEQQMIIEEDLQKVTEPYAPSELYLSFLDTTSYFECLEEEDEELRQELLSLSGREIFIDNLNRFVVSHELLAKISKPLYQTADQIRSALKKSNSGVDKDVAAFVETIEHRRRMMLDGKTVLLRSVRSIAEKYRDQIVGIGRDTASAGCGCTEEATFNDCMAKGQHEIEDLIAKSSDDLEDCIKRVVADMNEEIRAYDSSEFVQKVNTNLQAKMDEESSLPNKVAVMGALTALGGVAAKFSNPAAVAGAVPLYAQIAGKGAGLGIDALLAAELGPFSKVLSAGAGHYITKFLTPNPTLLEQAGALFARNASKIATALGVAAAAYGIYANYKESELQEQADKARREMKADLMSKFNQMADDYYQKTISAANRYTAENIDPILVSLDSDIEKISFSQKQTSAAQIKLQGLLHDTESLIGKIQTAN